MLYVPFYHASTIVIISRIVRKKNIAPYANSRETRMDIRFRTV